MDSYSILGNILSEGNVDCTLLDVYKWAHILGWFANTFGSSGFVMATGGKALLKIHISLFMKSQTMSLNFEN